MNAVLEPPAMWGEDVAQLRIPPHNLEAESSVLGGLLMDNGLWATVCDLVSPGDFYHHEHKLTFAAVAALVSNGKPADVITVFEQLRSAGKTEEVGGLVYLNALAQYVPGASHIRRHAEIVRERAILRRLVSVSDEIATAAFNSQGKSVDDVLDTAARLFDSIKAARTIVRPVARSLDLAELSRAQAPERRWIRQDWIAPGPMLVAGSGGSGKSSMTQHEATAGALGRAYFAAECAPYRSLIWNCEDEHDEVWRRQERICHHEQIDMATLAGQLHLVSRYGAENALMAPVQGSLVATRLLEELRQQVNDLAIDVLWLDNAAHVFLGDHDNRTDVTQFINALNGLVRGRPFTVAIVAHPGRALGSEFSGSVAWENAVRMRWYLGSKLPDQRATEDDDDAGRSDVRFLAKRKSNYSARDYVRMTMQHGLLVPDQVAQSHVGGILAHIDEQKAEEVCIAGFRSLRSMGIRATDGKTSPDYLPTQMVSKGLATGFSKSEIGQAMNRLMTRGTFVRAVIGQHTNRSAKFGLVLKEEAI